MATQAVSEQYQQAKQFEAASGYPLANVLGEGPNVSIRADSTREVMREILAWILAGMGLGAMSWAVFQFAMWFAH